MFNDQILNTETINESLSNRQSAKMMFLQKENEQLISENEDLKDALKLNKEALRIAYQCSFGKNSGSTNLAGSKSQGQKMEYSADDFTIKLTQENEKLLGMLSKMSKERNKAQSVALLQEQIGQESSNFLSEQIAEREEKIKELRILIQDKEFVIQEFEKSKGYYDYSQNVLIKIREITTPNDQSMKLHTEIEHLRTLITKLSEENHRLNTRILLKEEHFRMIKQEVLKLRMVILNPVNYQKMRGFIMRNYAEKGDEDAFMCGAFYKEVEQQQTEETNLQLEKEQKDKLLQYQKELIEKQHTPLRPTRVAGPFPSTKNQQTSQNQGMNTQGSLLTQGNQPLHMPFSGNLQIDKLTEKIAKLEENLKKMSKLHKKEVENNNILVSKIEEILRECDTCFNNNELLIGSNLAFQSQIEDLRNQIIHFRAFQGKYFQLIRNHRRRYASACFMDTPTERQLDEVLQRKGIITKEKEKTTATNPSELQKEVNVSILEEEGEEESGFKKQKNQNNYSNHRQYWCDIRYDLAEKRSKAVTGQDEANNLLKDLDSDTQLTKDQAKLYLLNLAKDLYVNTSIKSAGLTRQVLKQIEIGGYKTAIVNLFRNKRCLSDPLDYICEESAQFKNNLNNDHNNHTNDWNEVLRRNRIKQAQQNALQQQQFGMDNLQEKEQKDQQHHHNILFNVDMSVIMDAQQRFGKSKQEAKKFQKIQVDSSFISNDGDVQELP